MVTSGPTMIMEKNKMADSTVRVMLLVLEWPVLCDVTVMDHENAPV